jgi:hypothetical protein
MQSRQRRVVFSWIAILAILLNALMPTVSVALENSRGKAVGGNGDWTEVCSVQGSTWIRLAADGSLLEQTDRKPTGAPASAHGEHCPYCLTHAASFALPPAPALVLPVWMPRADILPQNEPQARTPVAWLAPAARAPPATLCF